MFFMLKPVHSYKIARKIAERYLYVASQVIYPSSEWAGENMMKDFRYRQLINPMMSEERLSEYQISNVQYMLADQGRILQEQGNVVLLNPLRQTIDQYLFGVPDIQDEKESVKQSLLKLGLISSGGFFNNLKYAETMTLPSAEKEMRNNFQNHSTVTTKLKAVSGALNGIASNAMDTIYFANLWLHLGLSEYLSNRPISILQSPKYPTRQIERYYGIIASMALGITPIQIGGSSENNVYKFEGMADLVITVDRNERLVAICAHSSRTHPKAYANIKKICERLDIPDSLSDILVVEFKDKYKELIYHLDLGIHVDEEGTVYLAENLLKAESQDRLIELIGEDRIVYIPKEEWKLYAMNFVLYDKRFNAAQKTAIVRDDCPLLIKELEKREYNVFKRKEMFPNGGGSARCRFSSFEKGSPHDLDSFLYEQNIVEDRLGANYAVVPRNKETEFRSIFDSLDLQRIIFDGNDEKDRKVFEARN